MDKTSLQQLLSRLEPLEEPDPELEQYQTPPDIAADVLHRIDMNGELQGEVVDLGCGNGILTIGAALLGAEACGVDVDSAAVETARDNLERVERETGRELEARFVEGDVREVELESDSVTMNPPFGIQREDMNRVFLRAGFETAEVIYALLHRSREGEDRTRDFLQRFASDHGFRAAVLDTYDFPLPRSFDHHQKEKKYIKVDLHRFEQV